MFKGIGSDAFWLVMAVLLMAATVAIFSARRERRRIEQGLPLHRDYSRMRPYAWFLRRTHKFEPCSCPTGQLQVIERTARMRRKLPMHARFQCTACHQFFLLDGSTELKARVAGRVLRR